MTADLRELVITERRRRGLSVRTAAGLGNISNTTWSDWEKGKRDLGVVQRAVSQAFGWPEDWPSNPPVIPTTAGVPAILAPLHEELELLRTDLLALGARVARLEQGGPGPATGQPVPARPVPRRPRS